MSKLQWFCRNIFNRERVRSVVPQFVVVKQSEFIVVRHRTDHAFAFIVFSGKVHVQLSRQNEIGQL